MIPYTWNPELDKIFEERFKNGSHWEGLNEYAMEHTLSNGDQGFKIWTSGQVEPSVLYGTNPNFVVALSKFDNLKTSPRYQDNNEAQTPNITTVSWRRYSFVSVIFTHGSILKSITGLNFWRWINMVILSIPCTIIKDIDIITI